MTMFSIRTRFGKGLGFDLKSIPFQIHGYEKIVVEVLNLPVPENCNFSLSVCVL
jgi:hypothetical protein